MTSLVTAREDARLAARIVRSVPLRYAEGADASLDRPAHVRAGSGLAWADARLAVVQDDASFLALMHLRDGRVDALALPAGADGVRQFDEARGNKADKLDLEALVSVPASDGVPMLLALGSGSTRRRESMVAIRADGTVTVYAAPAVYATLRATTDFAGSELNVEGAVFVDDEAGGALRLFNRGNGAPNGTLAPVNATCDLAWRALVVHLAAPAVVPPPPPRRVVRYDLGAIAGVALTFTDATLDARTGVTLYTAAAELSPDVTRDGPVAGCAIGVIAGDDARWTPLLDASGAPFLGKVEGIALDPTDATRAWVVVDRDAHDVPSDLCEVALDGPWR